VKIPPEITYRNVEKTEAIDSLVRSKIEKLERFCDRINSCRIAIEKVHEHPKKGSPYRVRLDITVPPSQEIAVVRNPGEGTQYDPLDAVIRSAFEVATRQLKELEDKQRTRLKTPAEQEMGAIVTKIFHQQGYGFLKTIDTGREIFFHQNCMSQDDFDRLEVGTGVQFTESEGEMGPQASTIHIVNKPGVRAAQVEREQIEPPLGWK
jgi:ribosomal subunit interface protein